MKKIASILLVILCLTIGVGVYLFNPFQNKLKSGLQVITHDVKASLFLNDMYLDKTPYINREIIPGEYTLRLEPDDDQLEAYELPLSLNQGVLTVVMWKPGSTAESSGGVVYELEKIDNKDQAELSFVSVPDGAIIKLDDREQDFAPLVYKNLEPGTHTFEARLPSFEAQQNTINLVAGYKLKVWIKLSQADSATQPSQNNEEQKTASDSAQTATDSAQVASPSAQVKIKKTNFFQDNKEVLRVRSEADLNSAEAGFVLAEESYEFLGEEKNNWYKIKFTDALDTQQKQGWVSSQYAELVN